MPTGSEPFTLKADAVSENSFSTGSTTVSRTYSITLQRVGPERGLKADPGGPYSVVRGARVRLDGSGSSPRGEIRSYRWRFLRVAGGCPDDTPAATGRSRA